MNEVKNTILNKIKEGKVAMRPRWHFVLKSVLLLVGIALLTLSLLYIMSFVLFILGEAGVMFVPGFGIYGIIVFLSSSVWLLVFLALVFIVALEILVQKYSFSFKKPLLYTVLTIVGVVMFGSYLIAQTPMHKRLQQSADRDELPLMGLMYSGIGPKSHPSVHRGIITELKEDGFVLLESDDPELMVIISENTRLPRETLFEVDEEVLVLGSREGLVIHANGVRLFQKHIQRK